MMTLRDIGSAAAALGNKVEAGLPLAEAIAQMPQLQPRWADFWARAALAAKSGRPLSYLLPEVWPDTLVCAVRAGEQAGRLDSVLQRIDQAVELQQELLRKMYRLIYPAGVGVAGIALFIFIVVFVLPQVRQIVGGRDTGILVDLAGWIGPFLQANWAWVAGLAVVGIAHAFWWLRTEEGRQAVLEACLAIPILRTALRDLYFGLWAHYMATMAAAGIPTAEGLRQTSNVLPRVMRPSVDAFVRDLSAHNRPMGEAANLATKDADDPRVVWWPFFISHAFLVAEQTGAVDRELLRVAPALIKEGTRALERAITWAHAAALALSGLLIGSAFAAYYGGVLGAMQTMGR